MTPFQRALEEGDIDGMVAMWAKYAPHLHQPQDRAQAEFMFHGARVMAESVPLSRRAWSHRWLIDRGLPSNLPDHLKPQAERIYPRKQDAVGVSVKTVKSKNPTMREFGCAVQGAMSDKAWEMMDDGVTDDARIKGEMMIARDRVHRQW